MDNVNGHVMNLANSIIGVSILAMPYCFKQCGIILSIMMLLISSIISRMACHFLLKSAILSRRKTFEFLAFHIFGSMGKLAIEIGMIGFLLGTCIAFFVVMGDLGPEIISEMTGASNTSTMRTSILMALALFGVLPLGLLRNVDSLNGVSQATIGFYCCLVLKVVFEATPHLFNGDWYETVNLWRPQGILQCLPIFSMALFCQSQLFEIYQAVQNATLDKMNDLVRVAVNICTSVYIFVGIFGYIAFANRTFTGNILLSFSPSFMTDVMKIGFVLSVAFSFPLVIFPCRASLYSLLYKEGYTVHEGVSNYIPEGKFKALTMLIVFISLIFGIMIPNIELVLGLVGSTIGVMISVLFPVTCFICISPKNTSERILAQLMLMIGIFVMVLGTYKNLHTLDNLESHSVTITSLRTANHLNLNAGQIEVNINTLKHEVKTEMALKIETDDVKMKEIRHEPPQPIPPVDNEVKQKKNEESVAVIKNANANENVPNVAVLIRPSSDKNVADRSQNETKNEEVDIEAIKKEDKEVELQEKEKIKEEDSNQVLIDTIQKQHEVQKEMVAQQKKLIEVIQNQQKQNDHQDVNKVNEEKLKAVKEIESIALKAIEKISGGKDNEKLIKEFGNDIKKVEEQHPEIDKVEQMVKNEEGSQLVIKETSVDKNREVEGKNDNLLNEISPNLIREEEKSSDKETRKALTDNAIKESNIKNIEANPGAQLVNEINLNRQAALYNAEKNVVASNSSVKNYTTDNKNGSAPLFLKRGDADLKITDDKNPQKLLPLPIAISNNIKNSEQNNFSLEGKLEQNILKENNILKKDFNNNPEVQAMRRDILGFTSKR